jgi:hypothetical protein
MNLAFKDIRKNLGRFVMTTIGIGMLLMVVMGMAGIYRGLLEDATYLINKIGADLWIVQIREALSPNSRGYRTVWFIELKQSREWLRLESSFFTPSNGNIAGHFCACQSWD